MLRMLRCGLLAAVFLGTGGAARAQPAPFAVFVTGKQELCHESSLGCHPSPTETRPMCSLRWPKLHASAWILRNYLQRSAEADDPGAGLSSSNVWDVSWNCYENGAHEFSYWPSVQGPYPYPGCSFSAAPAAGSTASACPNNDSAFLADLGRHLNSIPHGRRVILVGHSFGGDSLLKAVNGTTIGIGRKISRPITALMVLDPTGTGGFRRMETNPDPGGPHPYYNGLVSSAGVQLFFNRFQNHTLYPNNYADGGRLNPNHGGCDTARACNEASVDFYRNADGSFCKLDCIQVWDWCAWRDWFGNCVGGYREQCDPRKANHATPAGGLACNHDIDDFEGGGDFVMTQAVEALRPFLSGRIILTLKAQASWGSAYLAAEGNGGRELVANRLAAAQWETFELLNLSDTTHLPPRRPRSGDRVALIAGTGHFFRSYPPTHSSFPAQVRADSPWRLSWEEFTLWDSATTPVKGAEIKDNVTVYLKDSHGQWLRVRATDRILATTDDPFMADQFRYDIRITSARLLSQGRSATQSSTYGVGEASKALDGNTEGTYRAGSTDNSVTHTENPLTGDLPWWQVDLGSVRLVNEVEIWNRTDCCQDRLSDFYIQVSTDGVGWSRFYQPGVAPPSKRYTLGAPGRFVRIQQSRREYLSLAEVKVWGD